MTLKKFDYCLSTLHLLTKPLENMVFDLQKLSASLTMEEIKEKKSEGGI